jgi:hypothetical protein
MMPRLTPIAAEVLLAAAAAGCLGDDGAMADDPAQRDASAVELAQSAPDDATPEPQPGTIAPDPMSLQQQLEPGAMTTVPTVSAIGWSGPGGAPFEVARRTVEPAAAISRRFGTRTMSIALRTREPTITQFPCTSCHLGRSMDLADERVADAHQNIVPAHPAETGGVCATCHAPDNVELLTLKLGERTTLDHAYRLCAQCHVGQVEAWAGGAHGKRLDGWQGRRIVMGCGECHDPHKPRLEPRIPFRAPRLQRTGGHD